jgi:anti-sigma B factor antagonist
MKISVHTPAGEIGVINLSGRFDAHEVGEFRTQFDALVPPATIIDIDLHDVNFIDSSALAELVRGLKHCRQAGGELRLLQPSPAVRVILELTGLDKAFPITPTT